MVRRRLSLVRQHGFCFLWMVGYGDRAELGLVLEITSCHSLTESPSLRPHHDYFQLLRLPGTDNGLDLWE